MEKFLEAIFNNILQIILLIIYSIFVWIYSHNLTILNSELIKLENSGWNTLEILGYKDYEAIWYFLYAILLGISGIIIIIVTINAFRKYLEGIMDLIINLIIILILIILLINVFKLISVPILKLIFTVFITGIGFMYASASK